MSISYQTPADDPRGFMRAEIDGAELRIFIPGRRDPRRFMLTTQAFVRGAFDKTGYIHVAKHRVELNGEKYNVSGAYVVNILFDPFDPDAVKKAVPDHQFSIVFPKSKKKTKARFSAN